MALNIFSYTTEQKDLYQHSIFVTAGKIYVFESLSYLTDEKK